MNNKKTYTKIGLIGVIGCLGMCLLVGIVGFVGFRWASNSVLSPQAASTATNPISAARQAIEQKTNDAVQQASSQVVAKAIEQMTGEKVDPSQIAAIQKALQAGEGDPSTMIAPLLNAISGTHGLSGTLGISGTKPEDSAALLGQLAKLLSATNGISGTAGLPDLGMFADLLGGSDGKDALGAVMGTPAPRQTRPASIGTPAPTPSSAMPIGLEQGNATLRLPSGKTLRLQVTCTAPKAGSWYEVRASTGVALDHPNYAVLSFAGTVKNFTEPSPMVLTIILGANGRAFSGVNPDVKLAIFQNGSISFTDLPVTNVAPYSPDFKLNEAYRFSGEWRCGTN